MARCCLEAGWSRRYLDRRVEKENGGRTRLSNGRNASAQSGRLTGFDERSRAEIDVVDMRKNADDRDYNGAKQSNDHNLQMRGSISALH